MTGMVYLIRAGETDLYKIGFTSKTPDERRASLQTGNPHRLEVVAAWVGTPDDERRIHGLLDDHRREGEWFELTIPNLIALLCQYDVASEIEQSDTGPVDDETFKDQIRRDIRDLYLDHGPQDDGGVVDLSVQLSSLLQRRIINCRVWEWLDIDALYRAVPFERGEAVNGVDCLDYCVTEGYVEQDGDKYRVDPALSQEGYDFFMELWQP